MDNLQIKLYFRKTSNPNWVNSVPSSLSLFIKYLCETGKLKPSNDKCGDYILLQDLKPYKNWKIPNTYYQFGNGFKYFYEINLETISRDADIWFDVSKEFTITSLDSFLDYLFWRDAKNVVNILKSDSHVSQEMKNSVIEKLIDVDLLEWFVDGNYGHDVCTLYKLGSAEWRYFGAVTKNNIMFMDDSVHSYGNGDYEELTEEFIHLFKKLNIKEYIFHISDFYTNLFDSDCFESLVKDKWVIYPYHSSDQKYRLVKFSNPEGNITVKQNSFLCKQKECGEIFYLDDEEIKFFADKKLSTPKRCVNCRKWNKMRKNGEV